jgi:ankyrin repeat protein
MKFYILLFFSIFCFGINAKCTHTRIINNSNAPVNVEYGIPIYSRADTEVKAIKSQQELQDLLHEAILTNSTQEIMQVVRAGADVNLFKDGKTPLRWATLLKKFNSVDVLKRCGALIPCPKNMLYRAILNDSFVGVKYAINAGADSNDENIISGGLYPLGLAVFLTKAKATQALLECGARSDVMGRDCTFKGIRLEKPLSYALSMKDIKTALILLKHDKNTPISRIVPNGSDGFECVIMNGDPTEIKDLILEFLQELIDRGYDINSNVGMGSIINNEIVQYKSVWPMAIKSPHYFVELLELFMKNGANPNQEILFIGTPLHCAVFANNLSAVKFLINVGADLNKRVITHKSGLIARAQTPLSYARILDGEGSCCQEIIDFLVKHGAK